MCAVGSFVPRSVRVVSGAGTVHARAGFNEAQLASFSGEVLAIALNGTTSLSRLGLSLRVGRAAVPGESLPCATAGETATGLASMQATCAPPLGAMGANYSFLVVVGNSSSGEVVSRSADLFSYPLPRFSTGTLRAGGSLAGTEVRSYLHSVGSCLSKTASPCLICVCSQVIGGSRLLTTKMSFGGANFFPTASVSASDAAFARVRVFFGPLGDPQAVPCLVDAAQSSSAAITCSIPGNAAGYTFTDWLLPTVVLDGLHAFTGSDRFAFPVVPVVRAVVGCGTSLATANETGL